MKKYIIMSLMIMIGSLSFAQKKEIKVIEKAIKSGNFADAKSGINAAEGLLSAMDDKTKSKFYFLKGQALYANGSGSDAEITEAVSAFNNASNIENKVKKFVYRDQITTLKQTIVTDLYSKGQKALEEKNFKIASDSFEKAYRVSPVDTVYLYNAALLAQNGLDYDQTLILYKELTALGYTGITTQYYATEIATQEEQSFPSKQLRDVSVKIKTHNNPRDEKTKSKVAEIAKNTALIYVNQGKNDKAIEAINKAKVVNPNDYNLLLAEGSIEYKLGNIERYREIIKQAVDLQPDNIDLLYNLGVTAAELKDNKAAQEYYDKVLEKDPKYVNALVASSVLIIDQETAIVNEMNTLGTSSADDKKFEELQAKRNQLYLDAIPYLEKALEAEPKNLEASRTLMSLYSAIDDTDKFKALKAKVEALEAREN